MITLVTTRFLGRRNFDTYSAYDLTPSQRSVGKRPRRWRSQRCYKLVNLLGVLSDLQNFYCLRRSKEIIDTSSM